MKPSKVMAFFTEKMSARVLGTVTEVSQMLVKEILLRKCVDVWRYLSWAIDTAVKKL